MKVLWNDTIDVDGVTVNLRCNNLIGLDPEDGRPVRLIPPEVAYDAAEEAEHEAFGLPVVLNRRVPPGVVVVIS